MLKVLLIRSCSRDHIRYHLASETKQTIYTQVPGSLNQNTLINIK